jgi:single-strand DNA-binding protein
MNPIVTLVGNIVREAELRFLTSGKAVANLTIVTKDRVKSDAGEWSDKDATFYTVTVWDKQAEMVAESALVPGTEVVVVGKLHQREYETAEGEKRRSLDVNAYTIGAVITRFASVKVNKAERVDGPVAKAEDPWATAGEAPF